MVDGVDTELGLQLAMGMKGSQIKVKWRHLTSEEKYCNHHNKQQAWSDKWRCLAYKKLCRWSKEHGIPIEYMEVQSSRVLLNL